MRNRRQLSRLLILSLGLVLVAIVLTVVELARFSRVRANLPSGLKIASIPVGLLDRQEAAKRLLTAYSTPVELRYNGSVIQMDPAVVDFQLNVESMLAAADVERTEKFFWQDYWDFLWNRQSSPQEIPLSSSYSEKRLRDYLAELSLRYDQPPLAAMPVPGSVNFAPGQSGLTLDPDASVRLIEAALKSLARRDLDLPLKRTSPPRPSFNNLEILLKQTLDANVYDDLAGIYLLDLQTAQEIHFARQKGQDVTVQPDIAFTASSIIKIPIMVSAFRRMGDNPDPETLKLLSDMIDKSGNESADWLMERVLEPNLGPLIVTEDMQKLGLENTFLAGKFTFGSPLLQRFETPANTRTDINTDPDPYSQTTPSDMGMLLEDIYQCAQSGGGALTALFPGEITQAKCQDMIGFLINNRLPVLITAGLPEGTQVAHKHGWVTTSGVIKTIGDAGIVYTLGGNYVLAIFLNHPDQLVWEPASNLIALLSQAVYNYYNPPANVGG